MAKRKKKAAAKRAGARAPTLKDALTAVQREQQKGTKDDSKWALLNTAAGVLRKLGA